MSDIKALGARDAALQFTLTFTFTFTFTFICLPGKTHSSSVPDF